MVKMAQIAKEAAARAEARRLNKKARTLVAAEAARVGAERQARLLNARAAAELKSLQERSKKTRLELLSRPLLNRHGRPSAFNQKLREKFMREQKNARNAARAAENARVSAERARAAAERANAAAERERVEVERQNARRKQVVQALRGSPRVVKINRST
jgi:hypothetical protein